MNHKKEAERLYDEVYRPRDPDAMELLAAIQAKATLAVAEQLRLANLIALATRAPMSGDGDGIRAIYVDEDEYAIRPEVAEALGIEQS